MDLLYEPYQFLGTGGAIGDALFFFCSGFTLFGGRIDRFDNWYKRRINRIYPSVIVWAIIQAFCGLSFPDIKEVILYGGGWFIPCIMTHYIALYFILKFMINRLTLVFGLVCSIIIILYMLQARPENYFMYGGNTYHYFRWCFYFIFTLFGAVIGSMESMDKSVAYKKRNIIYLLLSIIFYYCFLFLGRKNSLIRELQILSIFPLLCTVLYFYKVCNAGALSKLYRSKYIGTAMKTISALTLEIYIVQGLIITDKLNQIFPLNILIIFFIIVIAAYIVKITGNIFSQTFEKSPYDWKSIIKIFRTAA